MQEQEPKSTLAELESRKNVLLHKLDNAYDVLDDLDKPYWINNRYKPRVVNGRLLWAERLRLDTPDVFDNLTRPTSGVIAIKKGVRDHSIPKYLRQLSEDNEQLARFLALPFAYLAEPLPKIEIRNYRYIKDLPQVAGLFPDTPIMRTVLLDFIDSPEGNRFLTQLADLSPEEITENSKQIVAAVGFLTEELALRYLKMEGYKKFVGEEGIEGIEFLSGEENLILLMNADPERQIINDYNLNLGIKGITPYDILIIREAEDALIVEAVVEVKHQAVSKPDRQRKVLQQSHNLRPEQVITNLRMGGENSIDPLYLGRLVSTLHPKLNPKPLRVNPEAKLLYVVTGKRNVAIPNSSTISLPVDTKTIPGLVKELAAVVRQNPIPVIEEVETINIATEDEEEGWSQTETDFTRPKVRNLRIRDSYLFDYHMDLQEGQQPSRARSHRRYRGDDPNLVRRFLAPKASRWTSQQKPEYEEEDSLIREWPLLHKLKQTVDRV